MNDRLFRCLCISATCITLAVVFGCRTSRITYIDPAGNEGVTIARGLGTQNWGTAADDLIESLLSSGVIKPRSRENAIVMISHIHNKGGVSVDSEVLTAKVGRALARDESLILTTSLGVGGPEDEPNPHMSVRLLKGENEFVEETLRERGILIAPDYSLSGRIIELTTIIEKYKQIEYTFQMTLTDLESGLPIWEEEARLIQKRKHHIFSW